MMCLAILFIIKKDLATSRFRSPIDAEDCELSMRNFATKQIPEEYDVPFLRVLTDRRAEFFGSMNKYPYELFM